MKTLILQTIQKEPPHRSGIKLCMLNALFMPEMPLTHIHVTLMGVPHILEHAFKLASKKKLVGWGMTSFLKN